MKQHLSHSLQDLITSLERTAVVNNDIVINIMKKLGINETGLTAHQSFDHAPAESYGRKLLYKCKRFELYLMSWNPGDITAIHNHGAIEWGCVLFFGTATHRLYDLKNNKLELTNADTYQKGQIAPVCGDLIHLMGNDRQEPFVTLHLYGCDNQQRKQQVKEMVFFPEYGLQYENTGPAFLKPTAEDIYSPQPLYNICHYTARDYLKLAAPFYARNGQEQIINNAMQLYNKAQHIPS